VSNANEIREFLMTRRAKLPPERAGLPRHGRQRRVSGLRREEVAFLAGISIDYYTRLERGNVRGVSMGVLDAVIRALQLDEAEHAHLLDLVRAANEEEPRRRESPTQLVRPAVARVVDAIAALPAFVHNARLDLLYANRLAQALYVEQLSDPIRPPNLARYVFLDSRARSFYADWEKIARDTVASLRSEAGRNPYDRAISDLIGQLSTRSEEFRVWWAQHDVRFHRSGTKRFRHPVVGDVILAFESFTLPADPGLKIVTYSAEPGSPTEGALSRLLSSTPPREVQMPPRESPMPPQPESAVEMNMVGKSP
jgi:transcriptional regulator with XRE-family HTH domain